jgi:hypothetical protein
MTFLWFFLCVVFFSRDVSGHPDDVSVSFFCFEHIARKRHAASSLPISFSSFFGLPLILYLFFAPLLFFSLINNIDSFFFCLPGGSVFSWQLTRMASGALPSVLEREFRVSLLGGGFRPVCVGRYRLRLSLVSQTRRAKTRETLTGRTILSSSSISLCSNSRKQTKFNYKTAIQSGAERVDTADLPEERFGP